MKNVALSAPQHSAAVMAILCLICGSPLANAAPYQDPPVFQSQNGQLDVLMIAAKRPQVSYGGITTTLWTYEVCPLPAPGANACPTGSSYSSLGGVRLALKLGDKLHVRLVNKLPAASIADTDHIADQPTLAGNPTNLHAHGFLVEPHRANGNADTYGDYVFVEVQNSANGITGPSHPGIDVAQDAAEYLYTIDQNHPPGLFWYHPHLHGISLNQVEAGMAGPITIGDASDLCGDDACRTALSKATVRHLVFQDQQVLADGSLKTQMEPGFCTGATPGHNGFCPGRFIDRTDPSTDFRGGKWLHTVSGQIYPTIRIGGSGDVWRIVNASGSRTYALTLTTTDTGKTLPMQILSIDGVALEIDPASTPAQLAALMGRKAQLIPCPGDTTIGAGGTLCASSIVAMPSSRVDVRVVAANFASADEPAILQTTAYATGDNGAGDLWPQIDLAKVAIAQRDVTSPNKLRLRDERAMLVSNGGALTSPSTARVPGTTTQVSPTTNASLLAAPASGPAMQTIMPAMAAAITPQQLSGAVAVPGCAPLATGHRRKILFGFPTPTTFGLGYVEVDENNHDIESTRQPIGPYDPSRVAVCVSLPRGNSVDEVWEIQNVTDEDHNFHIHQTRFYLLAGGVPTGTTIPTDLAGSMVLHDNVPIPRPSNAQNCDGTIGPVLAGACVPTSTFVRIPFRYVGDFVFHCHILEHEDGGMMSRIRVVATP